MRTGVVWAALAAGLMLAGCASNSNEVASAYVSPIPYQSYTCQQIGEESERVSARAFALAGEQDSKANRDAVWTAVAVVVFWPAAFAVKGNDAQTAELARLRGEMDALEQVSIRKNCGIVFKHPPPSAPTDPAAKPAY